MSLQIDIFANFDRELTDPEYRALDLALRESRLVDDSFDEVHEHGAALMHKGYDDMCLFENMIATAVPSDVTVSVEYSYRNCEEPGTEYAFFGPKADEYEIEYCTREIRTLQHRIEVAQQRLATKGA